MSKGKYLLLGFVIGGTVSAAATLLTTPASGKVVRSKVKEQSGELKKVMDNLIQDAFRLKDQIAKTSKDGVAILSDLTQDIKTSVEEWKESINPRQQNIQDYLEQIESSIKELEAKINNTNSSSEA